MENKIKILICDDVEDNRLIMSSMLKRIEDVVIYEACDGVEALESMKHYNHDIVLMDLMMPNMDGFEATRRIKENYPQTTVMIVTALAESEHEEALAKMGAVSYIRKPLDRDVVRLKVANAVRRIKAQNGSITLFQNKRPFSPLAYEVLPHKTIFQIMEEADIMDLGMWLADVYRCNNHSITSDFDKGIEFLYKILANALRKISLLTVIIEQDFETFFVTFHYSDTFDKSITDRYLVGMGENAVIADGVVAIRFEKVSSQKIFPSLSETPTEEITPREKRAIEDREKVLLRRSHDDKITAIEFMSGLSDYLLEELEDLHDLERLWQEYLDTYGEQFDENILLQMSDNAIMKYAYILNQTYEFASLGYVLSTLATMLKNRSSEEKMSPDVSGKFLALMGFLLHDLREWRWTIFKRKEAENIHYLDASLLSSCMQIEALITQKEVDTGDDDELELF